jgi:hypothetical protein
MRRNARLACPDQMDAADKVSLAGEGHEHRSLPAEPLFCARSADAPIVGDQRQTGQRRVSTEGPGAYPGVQSRVSGSDKCGIMLTGCWPGASWHCGNSLAGAELGHSLYGDG